MDDKSDKALGLKVSEIEAELLRRARELGPGNHHTWGHALHQGQQTWVGLDPETLQTPYAELKEICEFLRPKDGEHLVDLGAGYGRLGLVLNGLFPRVFFTGFEYVSERVEEGKRVLNEQGCSRARLLLEDLSREDFVMPLADYYFIYDYGNIREIRRTLDQLGEIADQKKITIVARGKGVRSLIQHFYPWLSSIYDAENFSIYTL